MFYLNLDITKSINFTASFVKIHVIANSCNSVIFFAIFLMFDMKVKVLFSFKVSSKQFALLIIIIDCFEVAIYLVFGYFWRLNSQLKS